MEAKRGDKTQLVAEADFFFNLSQRINNSRNFGLILGVIMGKGSQVYGDKRGKFQKKNY